jgi:hypothetical protein
VQVAFFRNLNFEDERCTVYGQLNETIILGFVLPQGGRNKMLVVTNRGLQASA